MAVARWIRKISKNHLTTSIQYHKDYIMPRERVILKKSA